MLERVYNRAHALHPREFPFVVTKHKPCAVPSLPPVNESRFARDHYQRNPDSSGDRPQSRYRWRASPGGVSLDWSRRNRPHPENVQIYRMINNRPVCRVSAPLIHPSHDICYNTVYCTSYPEKSPIFPTVRLTRHRPHKPGNTASAAATGIVPFDQSLQTWDVRQEMLLPVGEALLMKTTTNPHKYLCRRRKGDNSHIISVLDFPRSNKYMCGLTHYNTDNISSLSGQQFTRRKSIRPKSGAFKVKGFDGCSKQSLPSRFPPAFLKIPHSKTVL